MRRALTPAALVLAALSLSSPAHAQAVPIINNGADAQHFVIVVLAEGYTSSIADQNKFLSDVNSVVRDGVFGQDFYLMNKRAFNVYAIPRASTDAGVSTPALHKNTALHVTYAGKNGACCQGGLNCWLVEGSDTRGLIANAIPSTLTNVKKYLVLVNSTEYGGCSYDDFMYATSGNSWSSAVVAHEYGHGVANLYDEYIATRGRYTGTLRNQLNCSSAGTKTTISWGNQWSAGVGSNAPTTFNAALMSADQTVGAFEGCDKYATKLYRPVQTCRMNSVDHVFCPVCVDAMTTALGPYLPAVPQLARARLGRQPQPAGIATPTYVSLLLQVLRNGKVEVLRAVQGQGEVIGINTSADALYEITQNERVVAAGPVPRGFMTVRRYNYPKSGQAVEEELPADSGTLSLTVPNATLSTLTSATVGVNLYKLNAGVPLQPITLRSLATLKLNKQLTSTLTIKPADLTREVNKRLEASRAR